MNSLLAILVTLTVVHCKSIGELKLENDAKKYLYKYGYTDRFGEKLPLAVDRLKAFQSYADLEVTGKLDDATIQKMGEARCGMSDEKALSVTTSSRARRYVHQGTNWKPLFRKKRKMELTWTLVNSGNSLPYKTVQKVMRQAIHFWHEKTDIDFIEIPFNRNLDLKNIEILVSFENGVHQDAYAFDGQGGTLAHAFYPLTNENLSGDVHFDDDEYYTYKSPRGRNLLWVATHELGHSLGLEHSNVRSAVMYPWYTKYKPGFKLNDDDVLGIQTLYGSRTKPKPVDPSVGGDATTTTSTTTTTTTTPAPTLPPISKGRCPQYGAITAIYYNAFYKQIFAFTDQHKIYFLGYKNRIPVVNRFAYYPKFVIRNGIDAIFTYDMLNNERTKYQIIFSGNEYHVYFGFSRKSGPHSIHNYGGPLRLNFQEPYQRNGIKHIDAAFTWPGNGRTYFFSGTQYWRYNNERKQFDADYPKPIYGNWPGLPKRIDSAYSSPDKRTTFFISENKYYLFDDKNIRVKAVYPLGSFLQCGGAAFISDNLSVGPVKDVSGFSIGSISDGKKPKEP